MNILFITPRYYPRIGGVEYVVKSVAERLVSKGFNITVLCGENNISRPIEEVINNVKVVRWPMISPGNAYHIPRDLDRFRELLDRYSRLTDVVHLHNIHSVFTVYSLRHVINKSKRIVLTPYYHGTGHTPIRRIMWIPWRYVVRRYIEKIHLVHTVSKLEASLVERDFGVRAYPIENGVDEHILEKNWNPSNYVMYSGRIERYKNIHRLGDIVKILNANYRLDLELRVYGDGPYKKRLESHLAKIDVRYRLNSFLPFEKYIDELASAALFALLSEKESYPQSVNEANAIGVPVIVAKPWGVNFEDRSRTMIVDLHDKDEIIARRIYEFINTARKQPKSSVPSWSRVVDSYINVLYKAS